MPPPVPPSSSIYFQRVMFFIDGTNLLLSMAKTLKIEKSKRNLIADKHPEIAIEVANALLKGFYEEIKYGQKIYKIIRKYWFSSYRGNEELKYEIATTLRKYDFEPVLFKKKDNREKGVDIALTMNMLLNAFHQNFDIGVLIAGDEDYLELVNEIKRYGPRVEGVFLNYGLSKDLKLTFDRFIEINPETKLKQGLIDRLLAFIGN